MSFSTEKAAQALLQILQIKEERANELAPYAADEDLVSSGGETDSEGPIFDRSFSIGGTKNILKIFS